MWVRSATLNDWAGIELFASYGGMYKYAVSQILMHHMHADLNFSSSNRPAKVSSLEIALP